MPAVRPAAGHAVTCQPGVPEHRGVVHPPGELARRLGQARGTLGDVLVRGVPGQRGDAMAGRVREGSVYLGEALPALPPRPAATRQTTAMARAVQPRVERCASALDAGCVMAPSTPGSDLAGSVK